MNEIFSICGFNEETKIKMNQIVNIMKVCKAGAKHHGVYEGGLFDHTYLICCYAKYLFDSIKSDLNQKFLLRACFYHDFGKIIIHPNNKMMELENLYVEKENRETLNNLAIMIEQNTGYTLPPVLIKHDSYEHTLKTLLILYNMGFREHPETIKAIMFHHGGWSDFKKDGRVDSTKYSAILHSADMIISQVLKI
jgi:putative nucleotidyltransferase with HDIG domain